MVRFSIWDIIIIKTYWYDLFIPNLKTFVYHQTNLTVEFLKENEVAVDNVMEFDNVETVKRAVEINAGISIVPQATVIQEINKQTLVAVPFEDGDFFRPLAAIHKKNKVLSPAMKQFIAVLKESQ